MWSPSPTDAGPSLGRGSRRGAQAPPPVASGPKPSRLLPVVQCLAEGGLLAVVAAAIQALFGEAPVVGPFEFAILAGIGMAWARRTRWREPAVEALGLPLLAVAAGAFTWILSADVRVALFDSNGAAALGAHPGGWIGAVAVLRGHAHHARDVDEEVQDRLMIFGLPAVAVAWLVGGVAAAQAGPEVEAAFTAVAFLGTLLFVGAGVLALGLARLATVRGDGAGSGTWFGFALAVAIGVTVIGLPAAAVLGVPLEILLGAMVAPIRILGALLVLLLSPVAALGALVAELAQNILPEGFGQGVIQFPQIDFGNAEPISPLPGVVFYLVVGTIILIELAILGLYLWWRWRERGRMAALGLEVAEERMVVFDRPPRPAPRRREAPPPRLDPDDPVGAYLAALEALDVDGRWPRRAAETPRHHSHRVAAASTAGAPLLRLAAAYQLLRYAGKPLAVAERRRAAARLRTLERALRR